MWILWYLLSLILLILTWCFILKIVFNLKFFYKVEFFVYSFLLWLIMVPFLLFLAWWIWIKLNLINTLLILFIFNIILFLVNLSLKRKILFEDLSLVKEFNKKSFINKVLIFIIFFWILIKIIFWWVSIFNVPTYQDDSFWNWNYRWKVWFYSENLVLEKNSKDFLWWWYNQYPMTPSMLKLYFSKFYWEWNEWIVNSISILLYLSAILILFFSVLRETNSINFSFLWIYILTWIPLYYIHWTNPYFDLFQWIYLFIPILFLYYYLNTKNNQLLILSIIFIFLLSLTKNEWLTLYLPLISVITIFILSYEKYILKNNIIIDKSFFKIIPFFLLPISFLTFKIIYNLWFWNWNNKISEYPIEFNYQALASIKNALFMEWNFNLLFFFMSLILIIYIIKNKKSSIKNLNIFAIILFLISFIFVDIILLTFVKTLHNEAISQIWVNRVFTHTILITVFLLVVLTYNIFKDKKWI